MSFSDSMFLFEIVVQDLKSFIDCQEFKIKCNFADVFSIDLRDPNEIIPVLPKMHGKKKKKKSKVRRISETSPKPGLGHKIQTGQSVLLSNNVNTLLFNMKTFPMELSLFSKFSPDNKLGSTHIRWNKQYIDYLSKLNRKHIPPPISLVEEYNVFDEFTSKRMATIKLLIKLSHLKDRFTTQFKSISENNPDTFMYTGFNSEPATVSSTIKRNQDTRETIKTGIIKTIYRDEKRKVRKSSKKNAFNLITKSGVQAVPEKISKSSLNKKEPEDISKIVINENRSRKDILDLVKSDTDIEKHNQLVALIKSKSCSSIHSSKRINTLNYIFADQKGSYGNQVYCVGYFTVQSDSTPGKQNSEKSGEPKERFKFKLCDSDCPSKKATTGSCSESFCSLDLPADIAHMIKLTKCPQMDCPTKISRELPPPTDDRILVDLTSMKRECCDQGEKVEEVVGNMEAKLQFGSEPCFCTCECKFGFTKRTTYCKVCGGYEIAGEELVEKSGQLPFPCPIYHKLVDKSKTSGNDSKKKTDDRRQRVLDSEKDKNGKKTKKDDRFKFNYGYQGIPPQIGHSQCAMPCTGTLGAVPKNMGWLWTAEDIPGMKFRPMWKPGATNKHVVRLLRIAKNPGEVMAKKKKKDGTKKRPLKRPLLIVHKKDGEYTVTMETMKTYAKPRALNQAPFEDKDPLTYTIGRTEEENCLRRKKKERAQRRLERAQREFIQSAFRDMCHEICVKTYQQALGILPDTENPECPCFPAHPDAVKDNLGESCPCSDDNTSDDTDTDSDEWIVEFTPPNALFDQSFKPKKVIKVDYSTQYTYLDYKVKLLDRQGNPVPRFFKGPDGKQQCSDLGGFWSPEHKWLEINVDGYIAPDGRWAPVNFIGPNGEQVEDETGKFQAANGVWLVVGVDGFVDCQGKWRFYPKSKGLAAMKNIKKGPAGDKKVDKGVASKPSETTWSCFGDVSPKYLSEMGIVGHGHDKKNLISALKDLIARGEPVKLPEPSMVPRLPSFKKGKKGNQQAENLYDSHSFFHERTKCKHPVPSEKGIVAVDTRGNKTYFRLKDYKNLRPKQRLADLNKQGISLSSFHVPCFHSFINAEIAKQQQRERLRALANKNVATQAS